jgi:hypothetical protein
MYCRQPKRKRLYLIMLPEGDYEGCIEEDIDSFPAE